MTGNAFLKRLSFQLDFLNEKDRGAVIAFYQKKIASAATMTEEEQIVRSFGDPTQIAEAIRRSINDQKNTNTDPVLPETSDDAGDTAPVEDAPSDENCADAENDTDKTAEAFPAGDISADEPQFFDETESAEIDVIFSKPATPEKAPEIVHSLENKEVKTLFGEKVTIEPADHPIEEIVLEPLDEENGLTAEEIEAAKRETLEKAANYHTASFGVPQETGEDEEDEAPMPEEKQEAETPPEAVVLQDDMPLLELDDEDEPYDPYQNEAQEDSAGDLSETLPKKTYAGILRAPFASSSMSGGAVCTLLVLLTIVISPLLISVFAFIGAVYLALCLSIILVSILLFAFMVAMIVGGVVELVYGITLLFDTVSVALIEIGIGTALFAVVTALAALIYEFLFAVMPRLLKRLTKFSVRLVKKIGAYLYGGTV